MTLIIALQGARSIWLLTDRRLTYPDRKRDDACKMLSVEGSDGTALMGYAGLGASTRNIEPSDWMNDLLVGLPVHPLEFYLGVIAEGIRVELPSQLSKMQGDQVHFLLASALVDGEPRLYRIGIERYQNGETRFGYTRFVRTEGGPPPRLAFAGSGSAYIPPPKQWYRDLFRLLVAFEGGRISPLTVADRLASVNEQAAIKDPFVSSDCIVTWRFNGGGSQFYSGSKRVEADRPIPTVANGMDVQELAKITMAFAFKHFDALRKSEPVQSMEDDRPAIEAELDKLSLKPKRKL